MKYPVQTCEGIVKESDIVHGQTIPLSQFRFRKDP